MQNIGTPLLEETDGEAINDLIGTVLRITDGQARRRRPTSSTAWRTWPSP